MKRSLRRRYGRSSSGMASVLREARSQGATRYDPSDLFSRPTVYRHTDRTWEAAIVKSRDGGGYYLTGWREAPFGVGPRDATVETIDQAIRSAH